MISTFVDDLNFRFRKSLVKKRAVRGSNKMINYIRGSDIIKRLNEVFSNEWDFFVNAPLYWVEDEVNNVQKIFPTEAGTALRVFF